MQIAKYSISITVFFLLIGLETLIPLFANTKDRWRHAGRNLGIFIFNSIALIILFSFLFSLIYTFSSQKQWGLLYQINPILILRLLLIIFLFDGWMYIWHRMNHEIPFLWRFHRTHHSDPAMDVTTAMRFHPVELIISTMIRLAIILILGMTQLEIILYETIMLPIIYFQHSNFYLPNQWDKKIRTVFITPWMHWVHHSDIVEESNTNYGTIFSWWDRFARTFRIRKDPQKIVYGVEGLKDSRFQTIVGMLKTPFITS
jgi:sterol desaturase/sphingolipid hydroxylase (fatty acid hydroxylase superfamily)